MLVIAVWRMSFTLAFCLIFCSVIHDIMQSILYIMSSADFLHESISGDRQVKIELASLDSYLELVFLDRQRAGRELRERARRVVSAIEVQIDDAVVCERRVEEASGFVGFGPARQVFEDEEQILPPGRLVDRLGAVRPCLDV